MARTRRAELIAYHEAGHAVLSMHYRLPVLYATIGSKGHRGGAGVILAPDWAYRAIQTRRRPAKLGPRRVVQIGARIMCLLAGFAAEAAAMRHWGKPWPTGRPLFLGLGDYDAALGYAWLCGVAPRRDRKSVV